MILRVSIPSYPMVIKPWKELEEKLRPSRSQERFGGKREGHFTEESEMESETASEWGRRLAGGK